MKKKPKSFVYSQGESFKKTRYKIYSTYFLGLERLFEEPRWREEVFGVKVKESPLGFESSGPRKHEGELCFSGERCRPLRGEETKGPYHRRLVSGSLITRTLKGSLNSVWLKRYFYKKSSLLHLSACFPRLSRNSSVNHLEPPHTHPHLA